MAKKKRKQLNTRTQAEYDERLALWAKGLSDTQIAKLQRRQYTTIQKWRTLQGLPLNRPPRCPFCGPDEHMEGVLVSPGKDLYRYWKCPSCGGEFWPAEETKREAG